MYFPEQNENDEINVPEAPMKKKRTGAKIAALCLCCALLGGLVGMGGALGVTHLLGGEKGLNQPGETVIHQGQTPAPVVTVVDPAADQPLTPAQVYSTNVAACVGIKVSTTTNVFGYITKSAATGSGFVISADGYVLTNYHVVEKAAQDSTVPIEVTFQNGDSYQARLVGGEEGNDVAVLKIDAKDLKPVVLGDSDMLVVGESVYAIGNPLGELTYSLADGLVSALDRVITFGSGDDAVSLNMLQTNCVINSGNSGGPLFNSYGQVIGITTGKITGKSSSNATIEGIGFAIPINDVKDLVQDIIEFGYVKGKPYMGITITSVAQADVDRYGLPAGAYVESVEEGSCSEKAGLRVGDIIIAMDDTIITSGPALISTKASYQAGDTLTLTVIRGRQELKIDITLDEEQPRPQEEQTQQTQQPQQMQPTQPYSGDIFSQWPFNIFGF